jgi:fatty acid desaturase
MKNSITERFIMSIPYNQLMLELKQKVSNAGLLRKAPTRGAIEILIVFSAFLITLFLVGEINPFLNALMMILVMIRSTYVAHDLIHNQYFSKHTDRQFSYFFGNFVLGLSANWWRYAHNLLHHIYTNVRSKDEDIKAVGGVFVGKRDWGSLFHNNQKYLYWLLLPFLSLSFLYQTLWFSIKHKRWIELLIVFAHFLIPLYIYVTLANSNDCIIFLATMYLGYGTFLGLVVITNHIGCEVIEDEESKQGIPWLDIQTRTSRNIRGGAFIHFICGGLNTQVEHHLFPKAPRFYLLRVAKITEQFCKENHITYYSTTLREAYKEIYEELEGNGHKTRERMKATRGL